MNTVKTFQMNEVFKSWPVKLMGIRLERDRPLKALCNKNSCSFLLSQIQIRCTIGIDYLGDH